VIKPLLELINYYSKTAGYQVNIQWPIVSLYTSNEQMKFKKQNTMSFILALPKMKYLGISQRKHENYIRKTTKF
jgi:hypothetical protein